MRRLAAVLALALLFVALGAYAFAGGVDEIGRGAAAVIIPDGIVVTGFGVLGTAIAVLWRHQVKQHKHCEERSAKYWNFICTQMGWTPVDIDELPEPRAWRPPHAYTSKNHPNRRKTDRPPER